VSWNSAIQRANSNQLAFYGTPAVISQPEELDKSVKAIFDRNSLGEMGVLTDKPQAAILSADLDGVDLKTATITIGGTTYKMSKPLPDDAGLTTVMLTRS